MKKNILVIAPHPDDESLGCSGTLLKHKEKGDSIHWLICTRLCSQLGYSDDKIALRDKEINLVSKKYGFETINNLGYVTTKLDEIPKSKLINSISNIVNLLKPNTVYIPYRNDVHSDHACVHDASIASTKSFRYKFIKRICIYETISETDFGLRTDDPGFKPNLWVNITPYIQKKKNILKIYKSELGVHPFPRSLVSIEALALLRGSQSNCKYAEAFSIIKEID